jgi:hypothetical protein
MVFFLLLTKKLNWLIANAQIITQNYCGNCLNLIFGETLIINRLQNIFWELNIHLLHHVLYGRISATITALKEIQSQIATKIDEGYYVTMGSLDLTAAFDVVNIDLLIKRLQNQGLPGDWMELLAAWLRD